MPSTDQTKKELDHIFFNLFELDQEDEEDWNEENLVFMSVLSDIASKHRTYDIALLSHEELRGIIAKESKQDINLPHYLRGHVKSLQFCLKNLQEKGLFSLDGSFDYSSIDESDFRNFWMDPDCMFQISSGRDTRPVPLP